VVAQDTIDSLVEFHGHMCPGLAMGIRAAELALEEVGHNGPGQDLVAIVEIDMCAVDAIQFLTGCTFGKGNLVLRDHGKNAYTFVRRVDGHAVRISLRPGGWPGTPEWDELFAKVRDGTVSPEEGERFFVLLQELCDRILALPLNEMYQAQEVNVEVPSPPQIDPSIDCASCGERTMETRMQRVEGRELCPPCSDDALAGRAKVASGPK
jgi:formylmethanofuran dehydrogenase subunit E